MPTNASSPGRARERKYGRRGRVGGQSFRYYTCSKCKGVPLRGHECPKADMNPLCVPKYALRFGAVQTQHLAELTCTLKQLMSKGEHERAATIVSLLLKHVRHLRCLKRRRICSDCAGRCVSCATRSRGDRDEVCLDCALRDLWIRTPKWGTMHNIDRVTLASALLPELRRFPTSSLRSLILSNARQHASFAEDVLSSSERLLKEWTLREYWDHGVCIDDETTDLANLSFEQAKKRVRSSCVRPIPSPRCSRSDDISCDLVTRSAVEIAWSASHARGRSPQMHRSGHRGGGRYTSVQFSRYLRQLMSVDHFHVRYLVRNATIVDISSATTSSSCTTVHQTMQTNMIKANMEQDPWLQGTSQVLVRFVQNPPAHIERAVRPIRRISRHAYVVEDLDRSSSSNACDLYVRSRVSGGADRSFSCDTWDLTSK